MLISTLKHSNPKLTSPYNTVIKELKTPKKIPNQMETRSAKRKRLLIIENQENDGGDDRISDLPDAALHHILHHLPIKNIAQTSMLSKRFRQVWSSFPDLDFTTIDTISSSSRLINSRTRKRVKPTKSKETNYINQVLALRDKTSDIRILHFRAYLSFSRLNCLIRQAIRQNVQELDIDVATNDYLNFPRCVITSKSLRVLKLKSSYPGFRLPPPSIMKSGFQSLQTLSLSLLILYQQPSLLDLFTDSSFPLLKKLNLDACFGLKHMNISCRGLEDLTLENCFQLIDLEICCGKLVRLQILSCFDTYSGNSWVKIDAPSLRSIVWEYNAITVNSYMGNLASLHEASIGFFLLHEDVSAGNFWSVSNFLCGLSHAHCLTLQSQCVEIVSKNYHFAGVLLNPFNNLKSLELHTAFNKHNIQGLASLFRSSPSLQTLIIKIINNYKTLRRQWNRDLWELSTSTEEQYWESQSKALKSFLQHLMVVKIHGFSECESDISLVKFLLKHGTVLQEMSLFSAHYNPRDILRREKIKSQMMGFSRASSNAKIAFQ